MWKSIYLRNSRYINYTKTKILMADGSYVALYSLCGLHLKIFCCKNTRFFKEFENIHCFTLFTAFWSWQSSQNHVLFQIELLVRKFCLFFASNLSLVFKGNIRWNFRTGAYLIIQSHIQFLHKKSHLFSIYLILTLTQ